MANMKPMGADPNCGNCVNTTTLDVAVDGNGLEFTLAVKLTGGFPGDVVAAYLMIAHAERSVNLAIVEGNGVPALDTWDVDDEFTVVFNPNEAWLEDGVQGQLYGAFVTKHGDGSRTLQSWFALA